MPALINLSMPAELGWDISPTGTASDPMLQQRFFKKAFIALPGNFISINFTLYILKIFLS